MIHVGHCTIRGKEKRDVMIISPGTGIVIIEFLMGCALSSLTMRIEDQQMKNSEQYRSIWVSLALY